MDTHKKYEICANSLVVRAECKEKKIVINSADKIKQFNVVLMLLVNDNIANINHNCDLFFVINKLSSYWFLWRSLCRLCGHFSVSCVSEVRQVCKRSLLKKICVENKAKLMVFLLGEKLHLSYPCDC